MLDENKMDVLKKTPLFAGIDKGDVRSMLDCLSAKQADYKKNEIIVMAGDNLKNIGIVVAGQLQVYKEDSYGNRTIMATLEPPELYGEAICCAGLSESPVNVAANEDSLVLLLDFPRILNICSNTCTFHSKLIENMLYVLGQKNLFLQNRMDIVTGKSVRAKVLAYLESFGSGGIITIPLNREQMAEYLCTDRSALSHELAKMKKEGLIDYHKNSFKIYDTVS